MREEEYKHPHYDVMGYGIVGSSSRTDTDTCAKILSSQRGSRRCISLRLVQKYETLPVLP
jgi:hypothetical protein